MLTGRGQLSLSCLWSFFTLSDKPEKEDLLARSSLCRLILWPLLWEQTSQWLLGSWIHLLWHVATAAPETHQLDFTWLLQTSISRESWYLTKDSLWQPSHTWAWTLNQICIIIGLSFCHTLLPSGYEEVPHPQSVSCLTPCIVHLLLVCRVKGEEQVTVFPTDCLQTDCIPLESNTCDLLTPTWLR